MKGSYPIIHKHFVITSTYIQRDASIYYLKQDFIKKNFKKLKYLFDNYEKYTKWWKTPLGQEMAIKIRVHFGYSPATYSYDILNHFRWKYLEYLENQKQNGKRNRRRKSQTT